VTAKLQQLISQKETIKEYLALGRNGGRDFFIESEAAFLLTNEKIA
jgi:hypothetical protein